MSEEFYGFDDDDFDEDDADCCLHGVPFCEECAQCNDDEDELDFD